MFVKLSIDDSNVLSFNFVFVLVKHTRMPLGKFVRNLNKIDKKKRIRKM